MREGGEGGAEWGGQNGGGHNEGGEGGVVVQNGRGEREGRRRRGLTTKSQSSWSLKPLITTQFTY
jgi:hypothetical protein